MTVQMRIFIGFLENKEIKMHLNQSEAWKEAKMLGKTDLMETQDQEKEYLGRYIPSLLPCTELKKIEKEIKSQLQLYCPKLNLDRQHTYLLSQLFFL